MLSSLLPLLGAFLSDLVMVLGQFVSAVVLSVYDSIAHCIATLGDRWLAHKSGLLTDCYDADTPGAWVLAHTRLGKWNVVYRWGRRR